MTAKSFNRLSLPKQRLAIARDALAQLKAKKFIATEGMYLEMTGRFQVVNQKNLTREKCEACAVGSALASLVRLRNKFNEIVVDKDDCYSNLHTFFGLDELRLIEATFEGWFCNSAASAFYSRYKTPQNRAIAIFKNIIKNNGTFKP